VTRSRPAAGSLVHLSSLLQGAGLDRPAVSTRLGIPYVVAEASLARKRRDGPGISAIRPRWTPSAARRLIGLNPADREGVLEALDCPERWLPLKAVLDRTPSPRRGPRGRRRARSWPPMAPRSRVPWLATVAMMREDVSSTLSPAGSR